MGDAAHGNLELHAVKVGVLAMLSVTYLGVTVCFVGIIFWESFFDSFRLWVSELSGWERLGGVEKVSVFWQKGEISTATLRVYYQVAQYVTVVSLHGPRELWVGQF